MVDWIGNFEGVEVRDDRLADDISHAIDTAARISTRSLQSRALGPEGRNRFIDFAATTSLHAVNALLAAAAAQCTLGAPPANIDMITDASGRLIYRCEHQTAHEWDLMGNPIP